MRVLPTRQSRWPRGSQIRLVEKKPALFWDFAEVALNVITVQTPGRMSHIVLSWFIRPMMSMNELPRLDPCE